MLSREEEKPALGGRAFRLNPDGSRRPLQLEREQAHAAPAGLSRSLEA